MMIALGYDEPDFPGYIKSMLICLIIGTSIDSPVSTNNAERMFTMVLGFNQASKSCLSFGIALDFAKTKAVSSSVN